MGTASEVVTALYELTNGKRAKPADAIKDFNMLLNIRDQDVSDNVSQILDTFQPTTPLGNLLRLRLIGRYKVSSEVWTLLQSDNTLQIKEALKFDWFFEDVNDPTNLVQNEIPKLSLSTRLKIINRYAKNLQNMAAGEGIYIGLKSRYGIKSAIPILPACGEEFIRNELPNLSVLVPPSVLMMLFDKHQSIATEYIKFLASDESSRKQKNLSPYKCVLVKLSTQDIDTYLELVEKVGDSFPLMKLGRRSLKKAIKNHFDDISKGYTKYQQTISNCEFIHHVSLEQVKNLYVSSLLPSKISEFFENQEWGDHISFLSYVKPSVRGEILISTFQMKYNKDCLSSDLLHEFKLNCLQYLPVEAKITWVNLKVPEMDNIKDQAEAIAYLPVETSLPRLKELITAQSDAAVREAIAVQMVNTLKWNQCSSGIKYVAEYFVQRFRNETSKFRKAVISAMGLLQRLFLEMDWNDWPSVFQFIDIIKLNNEIPFCQSSLRKIYSQYIHACFLQKIDVKPYLIDYVEFEQRANEHVRSSIFNIGEGTPYHRQCLEWFLQEFPNLKLESDEDGDVSYYLISLITDLIDAIVTYNHDHKQLKIELPDWLVKEVERIVSSVPDEPYEVQKIFEQLIDNKDFELHDRLLLEHFPKFSDTKTLCRFLKKHGALILSNLDFFANNMLKSYYYRDDNSFYKRCKLYDDIRVELVKICVTKLGQALEADEGENSENFRMKTKAVKVLAELMEPSAYLEFVENRTPGNIKESPKEIKKMEYAIQRALYTSLGRFSTPLDTLPVLRKLVGGFYHKIACTSLVGVCVKIPENVILVTFEEWASCPVSLRKRILRLIYNIAPVEYSVAAFKKLFEAENNASLRLVLFVQIRDRFIAEPTDDSYSTFVSVVQQLNEGDKVILHKLFDISNIHDAYLSQYVELVWQLLDSKWTNMLPTGKSKIIEKVDQRVIQLLSDSACDSLLVHELSLKLPKLSPSKYMCNYLLYSHSNDVQRHRVDTVMAVMEPHIKALWCESERSGNGPVFVLRHLVGDIVESLCSESLSSGDSARAASVLSSMKISLLKLVEQRDLLKESIQLDAYTLYLSLKDSGEESTYASALAELYNNYIHQYDSEFGYVLIRCLAGDIPMVSNTKLAHALLKNHSHPTCHILATKILDNVLGDEDVSLFTTIIEVLSSSSHPHVQAAASDYFRSLELTTVLPPDHLWTKCLVSY